MAFAKFYENSDKYTAPWLNPFLTQQIKERNQVKHLGISIIKTQSKNKPLFKIPRIQDQTAVKSRASSTFPCSFSRSTDYDLCPSESNEDEEDNLGSDTETAYDTSLSDSDTSCSFSEDTNHSILSSENVREDCCNLEKQRRVTESNQFWGVFNDNKPICPKSEKEHYEMKEKKLQIEFPLQHGLPHVKKAVRRKSKLTGANMSAKISILIEDVRLKLKKMTIKTSEKIPLDVVIHPNSLKHRARIRRRVRNHKGSADPLCGKNKEKVQDNDAKIAVCCEYCKRHKQYMNEILKSSKETIHTIEELMTREKCCLSKPQSK